MKKLFIGAATGAVLAASGAAMAGDADKVEYLGPINKHAFFDGYPGKEGLYDPNGSRDFAVQFRIKTGRDAMAFGPTCDYLNKAPEQNEKDLLRQIANEGLDADSPEIKGKVRKIIGMARFDCFAGS